MTDFSKAVEAFARKAKEQMREVMQDSIRDVMEDIQTPRDGGQMPVDTGRLINSVASGLNGSMGPASGTADPDGAGSRASYEATIAAMEPGDTARFAWTAPYAMLAEIGGGDRPGNHFVGTAAAKWPEVVARNVERVKSK